MSWYDFIDLRTPLVFSPKVTPDPSASERLEEKLLVALQKLEQVPPQHRLRKSAFSPASRSALARVPPKA